jgi:predicted dinucleotide-binding enzyme
MLITISPEPRLPSPESPVKAFNHLPADQLGTNTAVAGQRQAVFLSSNDADASAIVATLATQLGFAPVELGRLHQGGVPFMSFRIQISTKTLSHRKLILRQLVQECS